MSASVWIEYRPHPDCRAPHEDGYYAAHLEVTYNLSPMLREAGFVGWRGIEGRPARKVGRHILAVLDRMARDPQKWRGMNPENGWGNYDGCLQGRMREWAVKCRDAGPDDTIGASL